MPFPRNRFARAGATPDQLDILQADYDALSPDAQAGFDGRLAPLSDYAVRELLSEPVAEVQEAPEPEPEVAPPAPSPSSSSSSSSSSAPSSSSGSDSSK